jgi:transposase
LRVPLTRDHLSAISGITPEGKLYLMVDTRPFRSPDVVRFLQHLLAQVAGPLLVIWDGGPIHRGQPVRDFLASEAGHRLQLERLPGYAPELNPDEGIWNYLKRVELKNVCCHNLRHLRDQFRAAVKRLRQKPRIIHACIAQAGLLL